MKEWILYDKFHKDFLTYYDKGLGYILKGQESFKYKKDALTAYERLPEDVRHSCEIKKLNIVYCIYRYEPYEGYDPVLFISNTKETCEKQILLQPKRDRKNYEISKMILHD